MVVMVYIFLLLQFVQLECTLKDKQITSKYK